MSPHVIDQSKGEAVRGFVQSLERRAGNAGMIHVLDNGHV